MDYRTLLYLIIGLGYVAYPLYYLTSQPSAHRTRVLGLGLMVYGLLILFWPAPAAAGTLQFGPGAQIDLTPWTTLRVWFTAPAVAMVVAGFAIYLSVPLTALLWLLALTYGGILLAWPERQDSIIILAAALLVVISFERCLRAARAVNLDTPR